MTVVTSDTHRLAFRILADGFTSDPWAIYVLGASGVRRPRALAAPAEVSAERGGVVLEPAPADGRLVAASTWDPAGPRHVGFSAAAEAGVLSLSVEIGPTTMTRLNRDDADLDRVIEPHLRSGDAYLWALGVAQDRHGQRLGRSSSSASASRRQPEDSTGSSSTPTTRPT